LLHFAVRLSKYQKWLLQFAGATFVFKKVLAKRRSILKKSKPPAALCAKVFESLKHPLQFAGRF
jgi:hypothetical protein